MKRPLSDLPKLFFGTFTVSALTFGGGYVIVPLLSEKFNKRLGWINDEEMLDIVAISQATPGIMAVNASLMIGWRTFGISGALVALLATILPPLILLTIISLVYKAIIASTLVKAIFRGLMIGVSIVILSAVWQMQVMLLKKKKALPLVLMALAFTANFFFDVNPVYVLLAALGIGILATWWEIRHAPGDDL